MDATQLIAAGTIACVAGVVRGITGFGGAMVMTPPLALLFGPRFAIPAVLLLESLAAMPMLVHVRHLVRWRAIGPLLAAACATVPLGGYVLVTADPLTLRRAIALIVILFSLLLLRGWRHHRTHRLGTSLGIGALSGGMIGATGIGGPPVVLYLLSGPDRIDVTRANLTVYVVGTAIAAIVMLRLKGILELPALLVGTGLAPGYYAGVVLGSRLFPRFSDTRFRQFTLLLLMLVSTGILLA
jgi:uncharacterized protein